ncbi:hypothetical protein PHISCL_07602 [Aspergillus sclerotialis]|uniref:Uncharacterized protein n=1 Tax=Aspergillus sclerotialis TaxID=2070753 RepID=A0A3A2ZL38_9EURO|nr:hypothetical protein PHISCL_07602 [Aspergillus sclerotialis]
MSSEKNIALSNSLDSGGPLPRMDTGSSSEKSHRNNAATGASAAGVRALVYFGPGVNGLLNNTLL